MKAKEHCDFYTTQDTPSFKLKVGDCTLPVNGRFKPHECEGVCRKYTNLAYKMKRALSK